MLKQVFVKGFLSAGLMIGLGFLTAPVKAQSAPSQTPAPSQTSPTPSQTSPAPASTPAEVSQTEVQQFANTIEQFQTIQSGAQQQASQILQDEQMSWDRFNQILQAQQNPQSQPTPEVSSEEKQSFDRAVTKLSEVQQNMRSQMNQAIVSQGLEPARFAEILAAVQQDTNLRQQVEQELQN